MLAMRDRRRAAQTIAQDPVLFGEKLLKIRDKDKRLVPLRLNRAQRHYLANRTRRDVILKSRQLGFSTFIQAEISARLPWTRSVSTLTLTNETKNTTKMRVMAERFYDKLPDGMKPTRKYANSGMAQYIETDSEVYLGTAGNLEVGRSGTYTHVHLSEFAFYPDAESILRSALQAGNPAAVLESTPNGAAGDFYEICMDALQGKGVWKLHFYPWWWADDYRLPLEEGEQLRYTEEEKQLVAEHGLVPEQIKWRRYKIAEIGARSFSQEYPEDPETCFLLSGVSFFDDIEHLESVFRAPVNSEPVVGLKYVAGLDWAQKQDYTVLTIYEYESRREVFLLRINKMPWKRMRRKIAKALKRWNVQVLYAEANAMGTTNIEALHDEMREMGFWVQVNAFNMNNDSKATIMTDFHEAMDNHGLLLLPDPVAKREIYAFQQVRLPSGRWRYEASAGHDDTVDARALAWRALNTPVSGIGTMPDEFSKFRG